MKAGLERFAWGLWRMITGIFFGIISILVYCGKQIEAFCKREPIASLIIAVVVIGLSAGWIVTSVNGSVKLRTAEYQRDSIGYTLDKYLQAYDSTDIIVVNGDTIQKGYELH